MHSWCAEATAARPATQMLAGFKQGQPNQTLLTSLLMAFRLSVASSSVWPPLRNMMPGIAGGTVLQAGRGSINRTGTTTLSMQHHPGMCISQLSSFESYPAHERCSILVPAASSTFPAPAQRLYSVLCNLLWRGLAARAVSPRDDHLWLQQAALQQHAVVPQAGDGGRQHTFRDLQPVAHRALACWRQAFLFSSNEEASTGYPWSLA